jgi:Nif-specific regulatory protein
VIQAEGETFIGPELLSARVCGESLAPPPADEGEEPVEVPSGVETLREIMDRFEKKILIQTLAAHGNNKTAAAKTLGITREGLHKKLKGLGL